uniref:Uncharacterized protein n=1 Tax=Arundo donax TaxID=35708 RepID=A0A0A9AGN3_ARUDO
MVQWSDSDKWRTVLWSAHMLSCLTYSKVLLV